MNQFSNNYDISNQQVQLVNILERIYNDNIRQINSMTNSINNLRNSNTQIRNLLVEILNTTTNRINRTNRRNTSSRNNLSRGPSENVNRIILNNVPYEFEHVEHYSFPRNQNTQERNSRYMQNFLAPVDVYPTPSQIETATRNVQYCDIVNPINRSCPISLETFNDIDMVSVIRFCGHIFNSDELRRWFTTNCRCPVCRYDIRNYRTNQPSETESTIQTDISNNFVNENNENQSSETNHERRPSAINTITTYLDLIFDNGSNSNSLSDTLLSEITNIVDTTDASALLTLLNTSLRRR
jgi:hypothetical protein